MPSLTFYGGVGEIGGNKILLEDGDTKIFLDFGMNFARYGKYYAEFLQPRTCNGIGDLLEFGIIPDIDNIYRNDLLENEGRRLTEEPMVDGVVVSHSHADHVWHISLLHKDIPIYCSEISKLIMKAIQETSQGNYYMDFHYYRENFISRGKKPKEERPFRLFKTGEKFSIGDLEIEPLGVDHSVPDAHGFLIHTSEGCIVYTGDLRFHGRNEGLTKDLVEKAREEKPIAMICEGTRVMETERGMSEEEVYEKINNFISSTKNLVVASFPPRDLDRFMTFYEAAKNNGREFAITDKQAYLLEQLSGQNLNMPDLDDLKIYIQRTSWGRFEERDYKTWQRPYLDYPNRVTYQDVKENQSKYVLYCSFYDLHELIDIKPLDGSIFIHSLTEPFNEEMEIDFNRMKNWLERFGLPIMHAHASGHACGPELKEMIDIINPKILLPVHTEYPDYFKELVSTKVQLPEYGETIQIA
jgi:ribonuclease J